jgi:hypothetical protein
LRVKLNFAGKRLNGFIVKEFLTNPCRNYGREDDPAAVSKTSVFDTNFLVLKNGCF